MADPIIPNLLPSDFSALSLFGAPEPAPSKAASVDAAAQAKRERLAAGHLAGKPEAQTPMVQELAQLGYSEILQSQGSAQAEEAALLQQSIEEARRIEAMRRDSGEIVSDSLLGVGAGALQSFGGLAAFGAGLVNDSAGAYLSEKTNQGAEWLREKQSNPLVRQREQGAIRSAIDSDEIARRYEQDKKDGVSYPELRRFGREFMAASEELAKNPALAGDLVAEGMGSLVASGGISKIAATGAAKVILKSRGITGRAAQEFLGSAAGKAFVQELTVKGMPASIGALEAGGTYAQIQSEIQGMSEAELMDGSPEYAALREEGLSHEQARNQIANIAGLEGGAIQGLVGAASGKLVARFEADPLGLTGKGSGSMLEALRKAGADILKEGSEEALQGGSSQLASNFAIQKYADQNRDILEGAGGEVARGVAAGAGMAGVLKTPELAAVGALTAGETAARNIAGEAQTIGGMAVAAAKARLDSIDSARDKASPTGTDATVAASQSASQAMQEAAAAVATPAEDGTTVADPAVAEKLNTVIGAPDPAEIPDAVGRMLADAPEGTDRISAMTMVMMDLSLNEHSEEDQVAAALWLSEQAQLVQAMQDQDLSSLPEDVQAQIQQAQDDIDTILSNPIVADALERAQTVDQDTMGQMPEVTDETVNSPAVRDALARTIALSQTNPAGIDPTFVNAVLEQARKGSLSLRESVLKRLKAAAALATEDLSATQKKEALVAETTKAIRAQPSGENAPIPKTTSIVREEILSRGRKNEKGQYGLSRHLSDIVSALNRGNTKAAQASLDNLRNFGEHMQNKVEAARSSAKLKRKKDNKVAYRTWTGSAWLDASHPDAWGIGVNPYSPASVQFAKEATIDAETVTNLYNNLLTIYGDSLKGSPLPKVDATKAREPVVQTPEAKPAQDKGNVANEKVRAEKKESPEGTDTAGSRTAESSQPARSEEKRAPREQEAAPVDRGRVYEGRDDADLRADQQDQPDDGRPAKEKPTLEEQAVVEPVARDGVRERDSGVQEEAGDSDVRAQENAEPGADADLADGPVEEADAGERFSHLSRVSRAYRFASARSSLITEDEPAKTAYDAITGGKQKLPYEMTKERRNTWQWIFAAHVGPLVNALNKRLTEPRATVKLNGKPVSPLAALQDGSKDWTGFKETRVLSLVNLELGEYEPSLVQAAALAAVHWVFNAPTGRELDIEDVAKRFNVDEAQVTTELYQAAIFGLGQNSAVESLARTILEFWGAEIDATVPMSDTLGIVQGLAAEMLTVMNGNLTRESTVSYINREGEPRTAVSVRPMTPEFSEATKELGAAKGFLKDAFLPQSEPEFFFDQPAPAKTQTQKGNRLGKLGQSMRDALDKHRQLAFYRNRPFTDLMSALGKDTFLQLFGYEEFDPKTTNVVDALSKEGKNTTLLKSWEGVQAHMERLEGYAREAGKEPDEVATHFDWYVVSNERIHARGFNPQSDKIMREAFVSTRSMLDLSDPGSKDARFFWLTVAQSSDLVKTEKVPHSEAIPLIQEKVYAEYGASIQVLASWLKSEGKPLKDQDLAILKAELGTGSSPKILHSLLAVARYENAKADGTLSAFSHDLSLEADGKTDGPVNAMMHFLTGDFSEDQLTNMAKGGVFIGEFGMTLNDYSQVDPEDLYQRAASLTQTHLAQFANELQGTPAFAYMAALMRLMAHMPEEDGDIRLKDGKYEVTRKGLKNPLTITVYGSGERGIAGKVANGLTDALYKRLSKLAAAGKAGTEMNLYPGLMQDLELLTTSRIYKAEGKWQVSRSVGQGVKKSTANPANLSKAAEAQLSPANHAMLAENILKLYVAPMSLAINKSMGGTKKTLTLFQHASQVMSAVVVSKFRSEVQAVLKAKRDAGEIEKGAFLSQEDYNAIFDAMSRKYGAVIQPIDSDAHHLNLSNKERDDSGFEFARSMDGKYSGNATLPMPSQAGVKAAPLLTISRGDAAMMVNFFAAEDFPELGLKTLPVFDGLEMAAEGIEVLSERINQAVAEAWFDNPARDVADSFRDFLRQGKDGPFANLDQNAQEILSRVLKDYGMDPEILSEKLEKAARSIEARKRVLRRVTFSSDHMASGEAPYIHQAETQPEGMSRVDWLNALLAEEAEKLDRVAANFEADLPRAEMGVSKEIPAFRAALKEAGVQMGKTGVTRMSSSALVEIVIQQGSAEQKGMLEAIRSALPRYTVLAGSMENLKRYRDEKYPDRSGESLNVHGLVDPKHKVIFLVTASPETALHELIHAALGDVLARHYSGTGAALTGDQKAAVQNLETLMAEFRDMNFEGEPGGVADAARTLQGILNDNLDNGSDLGRSTALHEFIAWSMANERLIQTLKTSRTRSKLVRLASAVLKAVRSLLGLPAKARLDLYSNIAVNTAALALPVAETDPISPVPPLQTLSQVRGRGTDARMQRLAESFEAKIAAHLRSRAVQRRPGERAKITAMANDAVNLFVSEGFLADPQQAALFRSIQVAMASSMQLDNRALARVQRIFAHVTRELKGDTLDRFKILTGKFGYETDLEGRTNLMASFLALSQVDPEFRAALREIPLPKDRDIEYGSVDEFLSSLGESAMNSLATKITAGGNTGSTAATLDRLAEVLSQIEEDDRTEVEKKIQEAMNTADAAGVRMLERGADALENWAERRRAARQGTVDGLAAGAEVLASLLSEERGKAKARGLISLGNQARSVPVIVRELMNEVLGITDETRDVFTMVKRVRSVVQGTRQDHRETLPKILAKQFSRELSRREWENLHLGIAKTDLAALGDRYSNRQLRAIFTDPNALGQRINETFEELQALAGRQKGQLMDQKARELARFMVKGEIQAGNHNLLRNAEAIARLLGEKGQLPADQTPSEDLVSVIDRLTTLYAINELPQGTQADMRRLSEAEPNGIDFVVAYVLDLRRTEHAKAALTPKAKLNGYKGYVPAEKREGATLIVADDSQFAKLSSLGYTRMGDYRGSGFETGRKGYYFSTVGGAGTYNQGAMQTVQNSAMGVDPRNGRSLHGVTAGRVPDQQVSAIRGTLQGRPGTQTGAVVGRRSGEPLMPIYDGTGQVVGYERSMDPVMLAKLKPNTRLDQMIGAWSGRQAEEELAQGFNRTLVDQLKKRWDEDRRRGRRNEYVNLADPDLEDPIQREAWTMIPADTKRYIREIFQDDGFPVRLDMVNNTVGYRSPSIGDAWTGKSRFSKRDQDLFARTAEALLGGNALKMLKTAEQAWQAGISVAKSTIVIRSVLVPLSNLGSNVFQLMNAGVNMRDIYTGFQTKLVEIDQYLKNLDRMVEIKALMARHRNSEPRMRKLKTEMASLEDSNRRMSIWPLIEAGEFSTISEGQTEVDASIGQGRWADKIQEAIDKVPTQFGTLDRYAMITRDTALFQGMSRATQYGDFLAKAVLYDHAKKQPGGTKEKALERISEEFVDYNLLPGRARTYAEAMGITWFWAYKLRSIKVAHRMMRDNPLRALISTGGTPILPELPGVSIGSPLTDNAVSVVADGRAGFSLGLDMLWHAPGLNPWINLTN